MSKQLHQIQPGAGLDQYVIEAKLGRGGQADVFLARDRLLGRFAALKVFRTSTEVSRPKDRVAEVLEEARLLAPLDHQNIVRVYHVGQTIDTAYMAMEYVPGGNLAEQLAREGPLSWTQSLKILTPVVFGLQHASEAGILHRDLKPRNLLVDRSGELKLSDFGLGRFVQPGETTLTTSRLVGTPRFIAPELWRGVPASERSDLYSLGACLYYMLAGHAPFPELRIDQLRTAHEHHRLELPSGLNGAMKALLRALLSPHPDRRPSGWLDLLERLRDTAHRPPPRKTVASPTPGVDVGPWLLLSPCAQFAEQVEAAREGRTGLIVATTTQTPLNLPPTGMQQLLRASGPRPTRYFELEEDARGLPEGMQLQANSANQSFQLLDLGRTLSTEEAAALCGIAQQAEAAATSVLLRCPERDATHIAARLAACGSPIRIQWLKWPQIDLARLSQAIVACIADGPDIRHWTPAARACAAQRLLANPERWPTVLKTLHGPERPNNRWLNSWIIAWAFDPARSQLPCPPTPSTWPSAETICHHHRLRRAAECPDSEGRCALRRSV